MSRLWIIPILLGCAAAPAFANPYESGGKVDDFVGSYSERVPIAVPAYHGIEPKLALEYNSMRGDGYLGVGWSLRGLSVIEKVAGHFYLDGQLLIPCSAQTDLQSNNTRTSPSCASTGSVTSTPQFYSTLSETYVRIETGTLGASSVPVFAITMRDGTQRIYRRSAAASKWVLSSVTDTDNHTVTYNWHSAATGFTFNAPSSITYNGTTISFYYDAFAGQTPKAVGETYAEDGVLTTVDRWLTTIDVCVKAGSSSPCAVNGGTDANRARAYKLGYRSSTTTDRELLTSIQMFGKNAVLAGWPGVVGITSGDAAPATAIGWSDVAPSYVERDIGEIQDWGSEYMRAMTDVDGDGRTDYCRNPANTHDVLCSMSTGWGLVDRNFGALADFGGDKDGAWVDWNADGKSDFCRVVCEDAGGGSCEPWEYKYYKLRCAISSGTALADTVIGATFAPDRTGIPGARWFADWNGDGRADFCRAYDNGSGQMELACATSTATGYTDVILGQFDGSHDVPETRAMVDWNGDGRRDFCRVVTTGTGNEIRCILSTVHIFDRTNVTTANQYDVSMGAIGDYGLPGGRFWVDVNGDGKSDYCRVQGSVNSSGNVTTCAISTGGNVVVDGTWSLATAGITESRRWGDLNRDGRPDMCLDNGLTHVCIESSGTTGAVRGPTNSSARGWFWKHWMVDWSGDGRAEYCFNTGTDHGPGSRLTCLRRELALTDLATTFGNGIGGTTTVVYQPSSSSGQSTPMFPIVQTVTRTGGAEGAVTHAYTYQNGAYDAFSQRFLGFSRVTVFDPTLPAENPLQAPFTETRYRLDWRYPTKPYSVVRGGGYPAVEFTKTLYTYADTDKTPYRSDLVDEVKFVYEGAQYTKTEREWDYDRWGNVETLSDLGNVADTYGTSYFADDREIQTTYVRNLTDYIVDKPSSIVGFDASQFPAIKISEVRHAYDGLAFLGEPVRGHATTTQKLLDTTNTFVTSTAVFDAGDLTSESDALMNTTTYTIDPAFHQYVTAVSRPAAPPGATPLVTTYTFDPQCGARLSETDVSNNATTWTTYDKLCRKIRVDRPGGGFEQIAYDDVQHTTEVSRPGPAGPIWERTYFDGLGRTTKVTRRGPSAGKDIVAEEYTYNLRGKLATSNRPRYATDPVYTYTYGYDLRDRQTSAVLPSATIAGRWEPGDTVATEYSLLLTTTADGMNHRETEKRDVRGKREWVCSDIGHSCLDDFTQYRYDARGNLAGIDQLVAAGWVTWTYTTDSLGRRIASTDPDAGNRSYAYDAVGNLTDQIDGNNAQTRFTYDALHRLRAKTTNFCSGRRCFGPQPVTVTWTYDELRAGYANAGRLTSSSDPSGTATYNYDVDGNLVQGGRTVDGTPYAFTKRYDLAGRLLATTYPDATTIGTATDPLGYDEAGRLAYIPSVIVDAQYDAENKLIHYMAGNGSETTFRTDDPRGAIRAYSTTGLTGYGPKAILGDFAAANTNGALQNYQTLAIAPALAVGQTITVSTCPSSIPGAAGIGATVLRLYWKGPSQPYEHQVAVASAAGGPCGALSTIHYTVPPYGDGIYSVHAGCANGSSCSGTVAAYLERPGPNLALGKPVAMSSEYDPGCGPASAAVDGQTVGQWCTKSSMAHSQLERNPWLSIDLGAELEIDHINVWNRSDEQCDAACVRRLSNFDVSIYDPNHGWIDIAHVAGPAGLPERIDAIGRRTQYVRIRLAGTDYLNTPEIEVFGPADGVANLVSEPVLHQVTIARDGDGRIAQIASNRARESWTYTYSPDAFHRLVSATNLYDPSLSESYAYATGGNMTYGPAGAATYGTPTSHPHAVVSAGGTTYGYDGNGQMTSAGWDGDGHLTTISGIRYSYDADGYRLKKSVGGVDTVYLGDDYEITGGAATKYISLGGRLVAKQRGADTTWLYTDHQGSVLFGLDITSTRVFNASYRPYGQALGTTDATARGYTGERADEAGMLYLHARFAHPGLGRFMSPDPMISTAHPIGMNRYAYAQNDPINREDIDGLGAWEDADAELTHAMGVAAGALRTLDLEHAVKMFAPEADDPLHGFNLGIGNTLALLPSSINAIGRSDWNALGKSVASEVVISLAIFATIMTDGTGAAPIVAATESILVPFALTAINTGNVVEAAWNSVGALKGMVLMGGTNFVGTPKPTFSTAYTKLAALKNIAGGTMLVAAAFISANAYVGVASRDQSINLAPLSQLSSSTSDLFGYGYDQNAGNAESPRSTTAARAP